MIMIVCIQQWKSFNFNSYHRHYQRNGRKTTRENSFIRHSNFTLLYSALIVDKYRYSLPLQIMLFCSHSGQVGGNY